jgi:hypothetical protein
VVYADIRRRINSGNSGHDSLSNKYVSVYSAKHYKDIQNSNFARWDLGLSWQ